MKYIRLILFILLPFLASLPAMGQTISGGSASVCVGAPDTLTGSPAGGTWSSADPSVASIDASSGIITAVSAGITVFTYTSSLGPVMETVTVNPTPAPISGPAAFCSGSTVTYADGPAGGTWSSSNVTAATIGSSTGMATGLLVTSVAATTTISYVLPTGCATSAVVTVNPVPGPITGSSSVCVGSSAVRIDGTPGGIWSFYPGGVATISATTGVIFGVGMGTGICTYTLSTGCYAASVFTVNPVPSPITGSPQACIGSTTTLADPTSGGMWSSDNTSVATVAASTGFITGVTPGTATIKYALTATGCATQAVATVNPTPAAIVGPTAFCESGTATYSDATPGGTWSSGSPAIAAIGSSSGIAVATASGVVTISYTMSTGCYATMQVTINPHAPAITGPSSICAGVTATFSDAATGGTWASSNAAVAVINPAGVAVGLATGTSLISYTLATGCNTVKIVTVNPNPAAITGPSGVCHGSCSTLFDATPGGSWTSDNVAISPIDPTTGMVCGTDPGTTIISYTLSTGCTATVLVTVMPLPTPIDGPYYACTGATSTMTDATAGGTWSSDNISIAGIDPSTGILSGISTGTATISYTLGTGCATSVLVTVSPAPAAITGPSAVCVGSTITLTSSPAGGTWTSDNTAVAVPESYTSVIYGEGAGTAYITYSTGTGCYSMTTLTVSPLPAPITGTPIVCVGSTTTLTSSTSGGYWATDNPICATMDTSGVMHGANPGTGYIIYAIAPYGCSTSVIFTVNPLPAPITGIFTVCAGATTPLADATPGGIWISSAPAVATISSASGVAYGISAGTSRISYTASSTSCAAVVIVTVNAAISAGAISGASAVCAGSSTTLTDYASGGVWSVYNGNATISPAGIVTGVAAGTDTVYYTASGICGSSVAAKLITITSTISPDTIGGYATLCAGTTSGYSNATSGGTWSATGSAITIDAATGLVTALSAGTATITYTIAGCSGPAHVTKTVTINPAPAPISGFTIVCPGNSITLSSGTTGGAWSSADAGIATVDAASGIVTGIHTGAATISYTLPSACAATISISVNPAPAAITGTAALCTGSTSTLADATAGGTWSSNAASIASVTATGIITAISPDTTTIIYTLATGCTAHITVTVNELPSAITGAAPVCPGATIGLADSTVGGTWSSSSPVATVATIGGASGVVTGVAAGTAVITYTLGTGCSATTIVTVSAAPTITASAASTPCSSIDTLSASGGITYSWSPATGLWCAACAATWVDPSGTTDYTVTGTNAAGCSNTATVTLSANRINGHISFGSGTPSSLAMKVWLIQYNAADSSLAATDSMLTCTDGSLPYYEFDGMPAGNYMVKAKLLSAVAGTSDYLPTYSLSSAHWDLAATTAHSTASSDSLHINMIYGTVPAGPGFIGGLIVSGAGKGTSGGVPVAGMTVYLLNIAGNVLTYTTTDASGAYSFPGIDYGSYVIYPEQYGYYTTHSSVITISESQPSVTNINFKEHTTLGTITPFDNTGITATVSDVHIDIYPNPTTGQLHIRWASAATGSAAITITDVAGRTVYQATADIITTDGQTTLDLSGLTNGIYFIRIRSGAINYSSKISIAQ